MIEWIWTSRLSIKKSLSGWQGEITDLELDDALLRLEVPHQPSERDQNIFFNYHDLNHTPPDSDERQYKSRPWNKVI